MADNVINTMRCPFRTDKNGDFCECYGKDCARKARYHLYLQKACPADYIQLRVKGVLTMTIEKLQAQVAELQAQVAALSVQTLAEDTGPSGYATSKYSVEEMDALLDKVAAM